MAFDLYTADTENLIPQVNDIARKYFSIDTATPEMAGAWYKQNPSVLIIAAKENNVYGYADFLPLTDEAIDLMMRRELKEEDILPEHILAPEHIHICRGVYFAGIAVRDNKSVLGARCTAALVSGVAHMLSTMYRHSPLEFFFANPTTFTGNRLTRRLGLEPISFVKKTTGGMDLYMLPINEQSKKAIYSLYESYAAYISSVSWS